MLAYVIFELKVSFCACRALSSGENKLILRRKTDFFGKGKSAMKHADKPKIEY